MYDLKVMLDERCKHYFSNLDYICFENYVGWKSEAGWDSAGPGRDFISTKMLGRTWVDEIVGVW